MPEFLQVLGLMGTTSFPIALKFQEPANLAITGCVSESSDNDKQLDPIDQRIDNLIIYF